MSDRAKLAAILREGAGADLWYDAHDHGDTEGERRIEEIQEAMIEAAQILEGEVAP